MFPSRRAFITFPCECGSSKVACRRQPMRRQNECEAQAVRRRRHGNAAPARTPRTHQKSAALGQGRHKAGLEHRQDLLGTTGVHREVQESADSAVDGCTVSTGVSPHAPRRPISRLRKTLPPIRGPMTGTVAQNLTSLTSIPIWYVRRAERERTCLPDERDEVSLPCRHLRELGRVGALRHRVARAVHERRQDLADAGQDAGLVKVGREGAVAEKLGRVEPVLDRDGKSACIGRRLQRLPTHE